MFVEAGVDLSVAEHDTASAAKDDSTNADNAGGARLPLRNRHNARMDNLPAFLVPGQLREGQQMAAPAPRSCWHRRRYGRHRHTKKRVSLTAAEVAALTTTFETFIKFSAVRLRRAAEAHAALEKLQIYDCSTGENAATARKKKSPGFKTERTISGGGDLLDASNANAASAVYEDHDNKHNCVDFKHIDIDDDIYDNIYGLRYH